MGQETSCLCGSTSDADSDSEVTVNVDGEVDDLSHYEDYKEKKKQVFASSSNFHSLSAFVCVCFTPFSLHLRLEKEKACFEQEGDRRDLPCRVLADDARRRCAYQGFSFFLTSFLILILAILS